MPELACDCDMIFVLPHQPCIPACLIQIVQTSSDMQDSQILTPIDRRVRICRKVHLREIHLLQKGQPACVLKRVS